MQLIEDNFSTSTSNLGYISAIRYCDNDYFITQLCTATILFLCLSLYTSLDGLEKEHGIDDVRNWWKPSNYTIILLPLLIILSLESTHTHISQTLSIVKTAQLKVLLDHMPSNLQFHNPLASWRSVCKHAVDVICKVADCGWEITYINSEYYNNQWRVGVWCLGPTVLVGNNTNIAAYTHQ